MTTHSHSDYKKNEGTEHVQYTEISYLKIQKKYDSKIQQPRLELLEVFTRIQRISSYKMRNFLKLLLQKKKTNQQNTYWPQNYGLVPRTDQHPLMLQLSWPAGVSSDADNSSYPAPVST